MRVPLGLSRGRSADGGVSPLAPVMLRLRGVLAWLPRPVLT